MISIFISQVMNNKTENEIKEERDAAIDRLKVLYKGTEFKILESYFKYEWVNDNYKNKPLKFLSKSIDMMANADLVVFIGDWKNARGCRVEHLCAQSYGISILNFHTHIDKEVTNEDNN